MNSHSLAARMRAAKIRTDPDTWIHVLVRSTRGANLLRDSHFRFHPKVERTHFVSMLENLGYVPTPPRYWGHINTQEVTCVKCGRKYQPLDPTQFVIPSCPAKDCTLALYDMDIYYKKWSLATAAQLNMFWQGLRHEHFEKAMKIWQDNIQK